MRSEPIIIQRLFIALCVELAVFSVILQIGTPHGGGVELLMLGMAFVALFIINLFAIIYFAVKYRLYEYFFYAIVIAVIGFIAILASDGSL